MSAETIALYAALPEELRDEVDYYAEIIRWHVKSKPTVSMSMDGAREVVIKMLRYMDRHEVCDE